MCQRAHILIGCCLMWCALPGCMVMQLGVSNPAPNLSRIAVAPFVNLSTERTIDGRRFAEAYYTELQKVPGFQVIPVGVVETAMHEAKINLDSPNDLLKLVEILDVDGICFGAVTEYTPYYPPRLGLQISWYSPYAADFHPGIAVDPDYRNQLKQELKEEKKRKSWSRRIYNAIPGVECAQIESGEQIIRGQNPFDEASGPAIDPIEVAPLPLERQAEWDNALRNALELDHPLEPQLPPLEPVRENPFRGGHHHHDHLEEFLRPRPPLPVAPPKQPNVPKAADIAPIPAPELTQQLATQSLSVAQIQPYMSYTRMFDGSDADLTAALRDYLELSGEQRSGGWTGYLHRSEDFIRFCMHRMINEMLLLHGGESKRRIVFVNRKYEE